MMGVLTTVSVLGSLIVWFGYHIFLIASNNQPNFAQARSLEEDNNQPNFAHVRSLGEFNNQPNTAQVRSLEDNNLPNLAHVRSLGEDNNQPNSAHFKSLEDFSVDQNKGQTNILQAESVPSLPQVFLDDRASKSIEGNFQKQQSKTPFIEDVPILPSLLLDDRNSKLIKNSFQNNFQIKASQIENVASSPPDLPNKGTSKFLEEGPNNQQTFTSLLPVVLNDINILKEGSQNGHQAKSSRLQNTAGLLQVLLGDIENRVLGEHSQHNLPTEIPQVDDVSNVLEEERQNKQKTKVMEAQIVPSLPSVVLDDKGNVLKEKDLNKEPREIFQMQNVPDLPLVSQDDMDSKALKDGGIQQDLHSNTDLYKVAEARSLFDLVDNYLNDIKPEIETGNLDDFHKDAYKEIPLSEDNHSEYNGQGAGLENNHSYDDDVLKAHKKLKNFKSNEHQFSLFDILKVPGFGGHTLPDIDSNNNPPKIYLYILHTLLSYVEYENAIKSNPIVIESQTTKEEFDTIVPVVSDVPQAANRSNSNEEDEVTNDSIDVESLSGNYMSRLDWEAQAVIGVSVVVILLLLVSIILFVSFYCKRRKRRRQHKKNASCINK